MYKVTYVDRAVLLTVTLYVTRFDPEPLSESESESKKKSIHETADKDTNRKMVRLTKIDIFNAFFIVFTLLRFPHEGLNDDTFYNIHCYFENFRFILSRYNFICAFFEFGRSDFNDT